MTNIITLESVSKTYRKGWLGPSFNAIHDVSLHANAGEAIGFIGHNGAGKSTTIRIIMGLQSPTIGLVRLQGQDPRLSQSRSRITYLPESPLLYDHLTPLELLKLSTICHEVKTSNWRKQCLEWLDKLGLAQVANKPIRQFSKGMVQRTALAMALAPEPHFLILDEPLSGLDPIGRREIVDILSDYRKQGGGLLFSSHVLTDVEALADRFLFIHRGKIQFSGTPGDLLQGAEESFEIIIETNQPPAQDYTHLYGQQFKCEVEEYKLAACLAELSTRPQTRIINIRSRNTLESAYFRFVAACEENHSVMNTNL